MKHYPMIEPVTADDIFEAYAKIISHPSYKVPSYIQINISKKVKVEDDSLAGLADEWYIEGFEPLRKISFTINLELECECGAEKSCGRGIPQHSTWCPKYREY